MSGRGSEGHATRSYGSRNDHGISIDASDRTAEPLPRGRSRSARSSDQCLRCSLGRLGLERR
jgi:hypothetical protein